MLTLRRRRRKRRQFVPTPLAPTCTTVTIALVTRIAGAHGTTTAFAAKSISTTGWGTTSGYGCGIRQFHEKRIVNTGKKYFFVDIYVFAKRFFFSLFEESPRERPHINDYLNSFYHRLGILRGTGKCKTRQCCYMTRWNDIRSPQMWRIH